MKIEFPDGTVKEFAPGITGHEIALSLSEHLARVAVAMTINNKLSDISAPILEDSAVKFITTHDPEGLELLRHSTAHIMASAVCRLFPEAKLGIGPVIEDGFYYDFDNLKITRDDLETIENEMRNIIKEKIPFERKVVTKEEALALSGEEPYKMELIRELPEEEEISYYMTGDYKDLCRGPHIPHTGHVKAFKLLRIAGAYWRGDSNNSMLTRIYGTCFPDKKALNEYLELRKIAEENDHVKLGKELDLFITDKTIGQGLPLLTPRGAAIKNVLIQFVEEEERKRGYVYTITPFIGKSELYKISGHWDHYKEHMFIVSEESSDEELALRPMTCPFQFTLYNRKLHSYKELPIRYAETSTLFRNESSGSMHGLIRIRQFTLAEGHIICRPDQLEEEFDNALDLIGFIMKTLDMTEYTYRFSKWDPKNKAKYIDNPEAWEKSEATLKKILDKSGIPYVEAEGESAFYGPKLDIQMKNIWGKEDTIITVQIDFALPGRFNMTYQDKDGTEKTPFIIHRSSIGCYERTMAILIEHFRGKFPFWIAPEQMRIVTVSDQFYDFAFALRDKCRNAGIRAEVDVRDETLNKKIRDAQVQYIPVIATIGKKEVDAQTVSVRTLDGTVKYGMNLDEFIRICQGFNKDRNLTITF
ncbi:MAG: threonine--tRNA ligase [Spirochaetales bacterium]|nr:threonine--tRNA ligase [Spirochaetales bacterium]